MPASAQPRTARPNGAPAYYLGRPATWWLAVTARMRPCRRPAGQPYAGNRGQVNDRRIT